MRKLEWRSVAEGVDVAVLVAPQETVEGKEDAAEAEAEVLKMIMLLLQVAVE